MSLTLFPPISRLKKYLIFLLIVVIIKIPWVFLMRERGEAVLEGHTRSDLLARRKYLIDAIYGAGAGPDDMPWHLSSQFQGEWAVGSYSMLTTALTNIAFRFPETRQESVVVVGDLIKRMLEPEVKEFDRSRWGEDPLESLNGPHGHIGYLGHLNWMLGAYEFLGGQEKFEGLFSRVSTALARRMRESPGFCLATYKNEMLYLPDNVVVIASLANFSRLRESQHSDVLKGWIAHAQKNLLDPQLRLLPFLLTPHCAAWKGVRGTGAGWNSFYLPYIDLDFARDQYAATKDQLLQRRVVSGLREYPKGTFGLGDVDSGPAILGFSPAGTGFLLGGAAHAKDAQLLDALLLTSEIVGSSYERSGGRRYLLAPLVGDAIMLAMKTAVVWDLRFREPQQVEAATKSVER